MTELATGWHRRWLRRYFAAPDAAVRLVCLPHAGGSASAYRDLAFRLSPEVDVVAVQYPGRFERIGEPALTDLRTLADATTKALLAEPDDRPIGLFGYSMGALVAFEIARRLEDAGVAPQALVVAARRAPSIAQASQLHLAPDSALIEELRRLGGSTESLDDPAVRRLFLPVIRADYQAIESYRWIPVPPLNSTVAVLCGRHDPVTSVADARLWARHTQGPTTVEILDAGHFFMQSHLEIATTVTLSALALDRQGPGIR